jgi:iduronate 2-sulfatase
MKAKQYLYVSIFLGLGLFQLACEGKAKIEQRPNVLMICIDDLNDWVGCMGGHPNAITPNIDRLASQGVLFTNAHCQTSLCGPSRASIMSGRRPSTTGIYGQIYDKDLRAAAPGFQDIQFLPEYFGANGYKTLGVGKIFHQHAPEGVFQISGGRVKGFGPKPENGKYFHWKKKGTSTDWGAFPDADEKMPDYKTAEWAKKTLQEEHADPFFLTVGFLRPHVPWYVPQQWFDKHPLESIQLPPYRADDHDDMPEIAIAIDEVPPMPTTEWVIENGQWKQAVQGYLASTTFVDYYVGQVLEALDNSPYKDNTIVVLWSDHGYRLGEKGTFAKHSLYQEGTNVPLIVRMPSGQKNVKSNKPVELLDLYPTLLDLCDLAPNNQNEGKSIKKLVEGKEWDNAIPAITTFGRNNHAIVTEQYRYIHYENGAEELYDHAVDPNEWSNLALDSNTEDIRKYLSQYLPQTNVAWSPMSFMKHNAYFRNQTVTETTNE